MKRFVIAVISLALFYGTASGDIADPRIFRRPRPQPAPVVRPNRPAVFTRAKFELTPVTDKECAVEFTMTISKDVNYSFTFKNDDNLLDSFSGTSTEDTEIIKRVLTYQRPENGEKLNYFLDAVCKESNKRARIYRRRITVYNVNGEIYFIAN